MVYHELPTYFANTHLLSPTFAMNNLFNFIKPQHKDEPAMTVSIFELFTNSLFVYMTPLINVSFGSKILCSMYFGKVIRINPETRSPFTP
mgnify:CR=1 FL=1